MGRGDCVVYFCLFVSLSVSVSVSVSVSLFLSLSLSLSLSLCLFVCLSVLLPSRPWRFVIVNLQQRYLFRYLLYYLASIV